MAMSEARALFGGYVLKSNSNGTYFSLAPENVNWDGSRSTFGYDSIVYHGEGSSNKNAFFDRSGYKSSMPSDLLVNAAG